MMDLFAVFLSQLGRTFQIAESPHGTSMSRLEIVKSFIVVFSYCWLLFLEMYVYIGLYRYTYIYIYVTIHYSYVSI